MDVNITINSVVGQFEVGWVKMSDKDRQAIIDALNALGCALVDHKHQWSRGERKLYEIAIRLLNS